MHAYYPCLTSWPSMLGEMLADAINCVGFTWVSRWSFLNSSPQRYYSQPCSAPGPCLCAQAASPASTELEMNVMDWLCKALGLPNVFMHYHPDSRGGGILQVTKKKTSIKYHDIMMTWMTEKSTMIVLRTGLKQRTALFCMILCGCFLWKVLTCLLNWASFKSHPSHILKSNRESKKSLVSSPSHWREWLHLNF